MAAAPVQDKFVTVYPKDGGAPFRRHRVDARDLLNSGLYSTSPVAPEQEVAAPLPQPAPALVVNPEVSGLSAIPPTREPTSEDIGFIPDLAASAVKVLRKAGIHTVRQLRNTPAKDLDNLELSGRALDVLKRERGEG